MWKYAFYLFFTFIVLFAFNKTSFAYPSVFNHGTTIYQRDRAFNGYTLFAPIGGKTGPQEQNEIYLINMLGNVVKKWSVEYPPGLHAEFLPNGNLIYAGSTKNLDTHISGGGGGIIQELDLNGNVLWEYENDYLHHDYSVTPEGNVIGIVWEKMTPENRNRVSGGIVDTEIDGIMWTDAFIEIDKETKEIIWSWHPQFELDIEKYPLPPHSSRNEWTHSNSVQYLPQGNSFNGRESILISLRQINTVMIVDKETGDVTWEWGSGELNKQHHPTLLDNGNILIFDNGIQKNDRLNEKGEISAGSSYSRVLEVDPSSNEIVWEYIGNGFNNSKFYSGLASGAQRLPNGNTLITETATGRIFEVEPNNNNIVWEYVNPYYSDSLTFNSVFRAYRYSEDIIQLPLNVRIKLIYQNMKYYFSTDVAVVIGFSLSLCLNLVYLYTYLKKSRNFPK